MGSEKTGVNSIFAATILLGLFGPKVDPLVHAFDILPTYEIVEDGFIITAHDIAVKNPEEGARMRLRWDEITSIRPMTRDETVEYAKSFFNDMGGTMQLQMKMSISLSSFINGKIDKPNYYITAIGSEAKKGPFNMTIVHETLPGKRMSIDYVVSRDTSIGVATAIDGPDIHYVVVFKKKEIGEMKDLMDAFEKAKGVMNIKI
jgi:hypothetical protein